METLQENAILQGISAILDELHKRRAMDNDLWSLDEVADYMKLSKKSLHNSKIVEEKTFPRNVILPTGGRRWMAKEVKEWVKRRHQSNL